MSKGPLTPGTDLSTKFHQETIRQGTGHPVRVEHNGKTFEGTPHEDGQLFTDIHTYDVHEVDDD